ncbi:MAG: PAS domain-containing protein [Gaiellaceae bacterium]
MTEIGSEARSTRAEQALRDSSRRLDVVFRHVTDGITVHDPAGKLVFANDSAAALAGYASVEELLAASPEYLLERLDLIDEQGEPVEPSSGPGREVVGWRESGRERWAVVTTTPVYSDDGRLELLINVFRDISETRRQQQRVNLLARAGDAIGGSLDYGRTLAELARLAVPAVADWCMVYVEDEDGHIRRLAVEHFGGRHADVLGRLEGHEFRPEAEIGVPAVVRTGFSELHRDADSLLVAADVLDGARLAAELEDLGIGSWMCVPLTARGRTFGALSFLSTESGRKFDEADLELAEELARRAALAVDNARLFEESQRSLALLGAILTSAPTAIGLWDRDIRYVRVNDALASLNELPAEEHVGKSLWEVVPDLAGVLEPVYRGVVETGQSLVRHETSTDLGAHRLGRERHWLSSYFPVKTAEGEIVGVGAVIMEITERKQAEDMAAARARQQADVAELGLRALAGESVPDLTREAAAGVAETLGADFVEILELLEDGTLVLAEGVGWSEGHAGSTTVPGGRGSQGGFTLEAAEPVLVEDLAAAWRFTASPLLAEHGVAGGLTVVIPGLEGDFGVLGAHTKAPRRFTQDDANYLQAVANVLGAAFDQRRLAAAEREARREAEARAQSAQALEFVGDGVFLVDRGGIVRLWNPAAEAVTGLRAADVVGRPTDEAVSGWAGLAPRVPIVDALAGASARPETLPLEAGGREVWLSISGVAFDHGTVYAFRDVTEERGVEKLKSDFVSTISHELRTPLAAIYGAALTLRRSDMPLDGPHRGELLGVIASESERLARIVNDILWTSRIESSGLQVTIEACDGAELAGAVVRAARLQLPPNLELRLEAPEDLPLVAADPDKVRQVLANLVENAVKYSPDGGVVTVLLEHVGDRVRFLVDDEGLGVPAQERQRIFEKFYRLDPNLTRGVGGTGLGLYICRELVLRMGGTIRVDSKQGRGSTFIVELPAASEVAAHVLG